MSSPGLQTVLTSIAAAAPDSPEAKAAQDRLIAEFSPKVGEKRQFLELFLIQPETGQIIAGTDPTSEGKVVTDQTYFMKGKDAPFLEPPYYSTQLGKPTMFPAIPLRSNVGQ